MHAIRFVFSDSTRNNNIAQEETYFVNFKTKTH